MPPKHPSDEDQLLSGPQVARKALPKSMQTSADKEDSLTKRIFFYVSGRAFVGSANLVFICLILGVVFSLLVMIKGFLCPDVSYMKSSYAFCPKSKPATQQQQQQ